eukprot:Nk52_evm14s208 gene=Nk52_evmTU14s208
MWQQGTFGSVQLNRVNDVLDRLTKANLRVSLKKCCFGYRKLKIFGRLVGQGQIQIDPAKKQRIMEWPFPKKGNDVEQLVGLLGWVHSHIPHYRALVDPFEKLKKVKRLEETAELRKTFQTIRDVIANLPPLYAVPDDAKLHLAVDASSTGIGAVLFYEKEGRRHFVDWSAKSLSDGQRKYSAFKFKPFLLGRRFELWTDHLALVYALDNKDPTAVVYRWLEQIMQYDFTITHVPGFKNVIPDTLSRFYAGILVRNAEILQVEQEAEGYRGLVEQEQVEQGVQTDETVRFCDVFSESFRTD